MDSLHCSFEVPDLPLPEIILTSPTSEDVSVLTADEFAWHSPVKSSKRYGRRRHLGGLETVVDSEDGDISQKRTKRRRLSVASDDDDCLTPQAVKVTRRHRRVAKSLAACLITELSEGSSISSSSRRPLDFVEANSPLQYPSRWRKPRKANRVDPRSVTPFASAAFSHSRSHLSHEEIPTRRLPLRQWKTPRPAALSNPSPTLLHSRVSIKAPQNNRKPLIFVPFHEDYAPKSITLR